MGACEKVRHSICHQGNVIKTITKCHYTPKLMTKIQNIDNTKPDENVEQQKFSYVAGRNEKWFRHTGK